MALDDPWGSLGEPWGLQETTLGPLEAPLGLPGESLGSLWGPSWATLGLQGSIWEGFDLQNSSQQQYQDSAKIIRSYDEGLYTENNIPYRVGFNRKENKYFANLINNSAARPNEVFFGDATTGIKGFLATVKLSTDATTDLGGTKELFAVSTEFVVSSR